MDITITQQYLQDKLSFYLNLLQQMVEINSFTANPEGVDKLGELTAQIFANLGFTAERVRADNIMFGHHLVLTRPGTGNATIGLISHLDTVYPAIEERQNDFHWRVSGERIYGPGTYDIKGGTIMVYMILDALQTFAPDLFNATNWIFLLNAAEEELVDDFGTLCNQRLAQANACLVFEGGGSQSSPLNIVVARKGMARYRIEVEGKSAHAGTSHQQGANAIVQMAEVLQKIAALTDYERKITFNPGTIMGGTVINRVPHFTSATMEMRAFDNDIFAQGIRDILAYDGYSTVKSAADGYPCQTRVQLLSECDPWPRNESTEQLLNHWTTAVGELNLTINPEERGGLSDGNRTWQHIPTIDGLGPVGGNAHCSERSEDGSKDQEYVLTSSFVPKALLNIRAIIHLLES